jgi:2-dehydropantoate 2-reductase
LNRGGLPASVSYSIESLVWGKLLVNVGINALTAILRLPNGAVATNPSVRALAAAAVAEAATIAQARGVQLPYSDAVAHMVAVAEATATNRSSMLQDLLRGAPTEIAAINGAIVREGALLDLPTPINTTLSRLIEAIETTADQRI